MRCGFQCCRSIPQELLSVGRKDYIKQSNPNSRDWKTFHSFLILVLWEKARDDFFTCSNLRSEYTERSIKKRLSDQVLLEISFFFYTPTFLLIFDKLVPGVYFRWRFEQTTWWLMVWTCFITTSKSFATFANRLYTAKSASLGSPNNLRVFVVISLSLFHVLSLSDFKGLHA